MPKVSAYRIAFGLATIGATLAALSSAWAVRAELTGQRQDICTSSPVPAGWIKVDDKWSPTTCGMPTNITYNVTTIERYTDRKAGDFMDVCTGAPIPTGWVEVDSRWSPTTCGHPTNITHNVAKIKKLQ